MNTEFQTIKEFIDYKKNCIFCNKPLIPILSNFVMYDSTLPVINSRLIDDEFRFDLKYNSSEINVSAKGYININSNLFHIDNEYNESDILCYETLVNIFFNLKPHVELTCNNKGCSSKYKLYSNCFSMPVIKEPYEEDQSIKIKPFIAYYDTCNINKYTVQSDWIYKSTRIIHKKNSKAEPIEVPFINFTKFTLDRLTNRISTIVAFL